jgi:hypothetical protein
VLLLAHLGYTVGGGWITQHFRLKTPIDFRLLAFMAILPDVLDRTLFLLFIPDAQSGRLVAHTLLFQLAFLLILVLLRRGWWIYGLASMAHLGLDAKGFPLEHLLWPLLGPGTENLNIVSGTAAAADQSFWERLQDRLDAIVDTYANSSAADFLFDIGGIVVILAFATAAQLYDRERLLAFARRGRARVWPSRGPPDE